MPTYEYSCNSCGERLEVVQSIHDDSLTVCPACGEPALRKVFGNVGVVFKGSGFYRTDSRSDRKPTPASSSSSSSSSTSSSSSSSATSSSSSSSSKSSSTSGGSGATGGGSSAT